MVDEEDALKKQKNLAKLQSRIKTIKILLESVAK